jgi:predicted AAA+ superfamily ATPase
MLEYKSNIADTMFKRTLEPYVLELSTMFPVVMVTGPRQVGKSTLLETCAQQEGQRRSYVTLDDYNRLSCCLPLK